MSFVLVLLLDVGLWDALLFILQHAPVHHEQARALLARALQLSRDVLPKDHATLNAFPELVHRYVFGTRIRHAWLVPRMHWEPLMRAKGR